MRTPLKAAAGLLAVAMTVTVSPAAIAAPGDQAVDGPRFDRTATLPVYENSSPEEHTAAEISAVTPDGGTVVYTDSPAERIGFADLADQDGLAPAGTLEMPGEPTSVDIVGGFALVAVNTSKSFTEPSGVLAVVDVEARKIVATHDLGGQPDSIDISHDGGRAAIAVENERDEEKNDGEIPQAPGGYLSLVDLAGAPSEWTIRRTELTGLAEVAPEDPEPEYVSFNERGQIAVTLQENNHIVVVDSATGVVTGDFSAGTATVDDVDTDSDGKIDPTGSITEKREPDAVSWLDDDTLATADEGDYEGGSRTWTVFDAASGEVVFSSGNELENLAISQGQYPEDRADKKGVEPEGIAVADYDGHRYAFVGMERANLVAVYNVDDPRSPKLLQGLPTGVGPEGLLPIPQRGAFVVSSEEDSAADDVRSSLTRYQLTGQPLATALKNNGGAPSITSDGVGFGALSGLSGVPGDQGDVVAVADNAYRPTRVLTVDAASRPAKVTGELPVTKDGKPVDYDAEGIAATGDGYWIAVEGDGKDAPNLLVRLDSTGAVRQEIALPAEVAQGATGSGFEGVAVHGEHVWVAVQREWRDNAPGQATLARYTPETGEWAFAAYPLDAPPDGGWIGLSELTALDEDTALVLERDNRRGADAVAKKAYRVDLSSVWPAPAGAEKPLLRKEEAVDLLPALRAGGGVVADKPEGLAVLGGAVSGQAHGREKQARLVGAVDNDGMDNAPGESVFLRLGTIPR